MICELGKMAMVLCAILVYILIAWIDYRTMEIPDWCHLILFGLGCIQIGCSDSITLASRGVGLLAMSLPMYLANLVRKDSFGGGDIKLCAATGFLLGAPHLVAGTLIALQLAGVYGSIALLSKLKTSKDVFPLGPFLSLGFIGIIVKELLEYGI